MGAAETDSALWRRTLSTAAKFVVSAALIGVLAYSVDWVDVRRALLEAQHGALAVALVPIALTVPLAAWRWSCCAKASAIDCSPRFYLRATYSALFMGQALPAGVGVDAVRLAYFMRDRARLAHALQSLVLDRLIGLSAMIVVMAAGLPLIWARLPEPLQLLSLCLVAAITGGLVLVAWWPRLLPLASMPEGGRWRKIADLIYAVRGSILSRETALACAISVAIHCGSIYGVFWLAHALGQDVPYFELLAVVSMSMFLGVLPISLNGWGVREGAMVMGLSALAVPREAALVVSILFGFSTAIVTLPGAFVWFMQKRSHA